MSLPTKEAGATGPNGSRRGGDRSDLGSMGGAMAGQSWVERTLMDLSQEHRAFMWSWDDRDGGTEILYLIGAGTPQPAREVFRSDLWRRCRDDEAARRQVRTRLAGLVLRACQVRENCDGQLARRSASQGRTSVGKSESRPSTE